MQNEKANWPGWETIRLIGQGSFGAVYEIQRDVLGEVEKAALKVITIPKNSSDIEEMVSDGYDGESITSTFKAHLKNIVAEYSLMRKMNGSSNIVNCDDVRYVQHDDGIGWDIYIKMELLTPLNKALPVQVDEETVIKVGRDLCSALELCRKHDIVHRDIKPQNIFVSENGDYKLGDFGIARTMEKTMGGTRIGTLKFMAPEVYNNQPYGSASDIYAVGLVLYWLLNQRRMPFLPLPPARLNAGMEEQAGARRLSGEQIPAPATGSAELQRIVLKACAFDPRNRYTTAAEMLADLENLAHGVAPVIASNGSEPTTLLQEQTTLLTQQPKAAPVAAPVRAAAPVATQPAAPKKKKSALPFVIIGAAVVAILALVLFFGGRGETPGNTDSTEGNESTTGTESTQSTTGTESTNGTESTEAAPKTITSVEIASQPTKTDYTVGDKLDTAGLQLKVTYSDGSSETVSSGFACDVTNLTVEGQQTVALTYEGKTVTLTVDVKKAAVVVERLELFDKPIKQEYTVGESLDISGTRVLVVYSDGNSDVVISGFECSPAVFDKAGEQTVTLTFRGQSVSFKVTVKEAAVVQSISVAAMPQKTGYFVGDFLSTAGLKLKVSYSDGTENTIDSGFTCDPTILSAVGKQKVTVSYGGKTASFEVEVKASSIIGISIQSEPTKKNYFTGDALDTAGLKLEVSYDDGKKETVTSGFTCSVSTLETAGQQTVQVSYGGQRASFTVTVKQVEATWVGIQTKPHKMTYFVGDTLNTAGMSLTVNYNNGTTETVTSGFTCDPTSLTVAGNKSITVYFGGKSATFVVLVNNPEITDISVRTNPVKTTYYVGDTLNTAGLTLTATYNNGTTKTVTSGFTCDTTRLEYEGEQTVIVTYGGYTATFEVTVNGVEITGISVKTKPSKLEYFVGEWLDTSGLVLTLTYSNGTTETTDYGYDCDPEELVTPGTQTVTVSYDGKTANFTVTVKTVDISKMEIDTKPYTDSYFVGETLDTDGLLLKLTYSNGSTDWTDEGFTCSPTKLDKAGTQTITVTYGGKTATFTVTVSTIDVTDIYIDTEPNKTTYMVGETLDAAGMVITAYYSNGDSKELTSGFTCTPTKLDLTEGYHTITVTFGGKTAEFSVYVDDGLMASGTHGSKITWTLTDDGLLTITGTGNMPSLSSFGSAPWFGYSNDIKSVYISDSITSIGARNFWRCVEIVDIRVPDSITSIGSFAFAECSNLSSIYLPEGLTEIRECAFSSCSSITTIIIPNKITVLSSSTFSGCYNLETASLPENLTEIGEAAFSDCYCLTALTIPNNVTVIGNDAFNGCANLREVIIPASVQTIGFAAFDNAIELKTVTVLSTICSISGPTGNRGCALGDPNYATIRSYKSSTAQAYAEHYGYKFEPLD